MKSIPIALQNHLNEDATTLCLLTRVETKDGTVIGFTDLDEDVVYDDGDGAVTYSAENGFTPSRIQATADTGVDNGELEGITSDSGITQQQIRAGLFDAARVKIYRINYMAPSNGHELVQYGRAGETTFSETGWRTEFRSLMQTLKQPISVLYSITCRARFGSKFIGEGLDSTGQQYFEEAHPCGKDFTWTSGTVTSVGVNPKTTFSDSGLSPSSGFFEPGVVEWLTGNNAGHQMEVYSHVDDSAENYVKLALPMPYAIEAGDTFRIRQDCSKLWDDAEHGCLYHYGTERKNHFQGEPDIPVADGGANLIPGAQITRPQ